MIGAPSPAGKRPPLQSIRLSPAFSSQLRSKSQKILVIIPYMHNSVNDKKRKSRSVSKPGHSKNVSAARPYGFSSAISSPKGGCSPLLPPAPYLYHTIIPQVPVISNKFSQSCPRRRLVFQPQKAHENSQNFRGLSSIPDRIYTVPSWAAVWKKGTAASSRRMNSSPKDPEPQLLAMAEDAFCR